MTEQEIIAKISLMSEQEIRAKIDEITHLKRGIEQRLKKTAVKVVESNNTLLTEENIAKGIEGLADLIIESHPDEFPVFVGLMDGALPVAGKFHDALTRKGYSFQYTTMQVSSYGGMKAGELVIGALPKIKLGNRLVIVVDDVCDTGNTFEKIRALFLDQGAKDVLLMTLVDKVQERKVHPAYSAFKVSKDAFIIGGGLDFDRLMRNELQITAVNKAYLPTPEEQELLNWEKPLNARLVELLAQKNKISSPGTQQGALFVSGKTPAEQKDELFYNEYSML